MNKDMKMQHKDQQNNRSVRIIDDTSFTAIDNMNNVKEGQCHAAQVSIKLN